MQPILSNGTEKPVRNEPHELLARLYREIGVSAVAVALGITDDALGRLPTPDRAPETHVKQAA